MNATNKALHHYSELAALARLEADQRDRDARIARLTDEVSDQQNEAARRIAEHTGVGCNCDGNSAWRCPIHDAG